MESDTGRLQKAALIAEIVGACAVVVSLMFVGFQLSRNTAEAIGASHHELIAILNGNDNWLQDPAFADALLRSASGRDAISESEYLQIAYWVGQRLTVCENVYQRRDDGLVDDDMWPAWAAGCADVLVSNNTARVVWEERKSWFAKDFAAWLDEAARVDQ
ncbi:MAG: hypothetical protein AAFY29_02035 [Pseudomonadota bacterium]